LSDATDVTEEEGFAYVGAHFAGLHVLDVSNPSSVAVIGSAGSPGHCSAVEVVGDYAYVADGPAGLVIFPSHCEQGVPVAHATLELSADGGAVNLVWQTSGEMRNLGFHVYRAEGAGDDRNGLTPADFVRITERLIRASGESGGVYELTDRDVVAGTTYTYRLESMSLAGATELIAEETVTVERGAPRRLALHQNRPNPFNPSTTIAFEVPAAEHVRLQIYDVAGRLVRTLVDERLEPDYYDVPWDGRNDVGRNVGSGVYFYQLRASDRTLRNKLVLMR
jgi:hypothetical protein